MKKVLNYVNQNKTDTASENGFPLKYFFLTCIFIMLPAIAKCYRVVFTDKSSYFLDYKNNLHCQTQWLIQQVIRYHHFGDWRLKQSLCNSNLICINSETAWIVRIHFLHQFIYFICQQAYLGFVVWGIVKF